MHDTEIIATCGCVCDLRASWDWVDESICDVEINIRIPCEYHRPTPRAVDEGDSAPLQAESTPEVLSIEEADTTPALRN